MKGSILALTVTVVLMTALSGLAMAAEESLCTDSDGGISYGLKGTAKGINGEKTDSCLGTKNMQEWYCKRDVIVSTLYKCPKGCINGACVGMNDSITAATQTTTTTLKGSAESSSTTTTTIRQTAGKCIDSDGGKNYGVKGTTRGINGEKTDSCLGTKKLQEWYCKKDVVTSMFYLCPSGCANGSCTGMSEITTTTTQTTSTTITTTTLAAESSTTTSTMETTTTLGSENESTETTTTTLQQGGGEIERCIDSDGGKNYEVKGYTRGMNGRRGDKCIDGARLEEAYCDGSTARLEKVKCEKGCAFGACRKK